MDHEVFEIEAETLELARQQAREKLPAGASRLWEHVLCDGKEGRATAIGDSAAEALAAARELVPRDAEILSEKELRPASQQSIEIEAFDEAAARLAAKPKLGGNARIEAVAVKAEGKKGLLGIGKKPSLYQLTVLQPASVEVRFKRKARIRVETGDFPTSGYCQMCGRAHSPAEKSEKSVHFFCSTTCRDRYFKAKLGAILFSPNRFVVNASGQDISGMMAAGRAAAARAMSHCWACGADVPMTESKCGSCGVEQEIKL